MKNDYKFVVVLDYNDGKPDFVGPFDTNQSAVNYGQGILASDEDCVGFTSERMKAPSVFGISQ